MCGVFRQLFAWPPSDAASRIWGVATNWDDGHAKMLALRLLGMFDKHISAQLPYFAILQY